MSCREITEKYRTKHSKKKKQKKMNILSYCADPIKKNYCLTETELASGKVLKSCEIILEVVFLVEWVECTINFIIIVTSTNWRMHLRQT